MSDDASRSGESLPAECLNRTAGHSPAAIPRGAVLLLLTGLVGIAVLLRTTFLSQISFWYDEACSWKISRFPLGELLEAVSLDAHPPLYYILISFWGDLFGASPPVIRTFSVMCGVGTVMAAWWLGKCVIEDEVELQPASTGRWESLIPIFTAMLVSLSALQVEMSHEARPYTLGTLLALLSGAFLLRATRPASTWWDWGGFAVCATALSFTHYYGLFTLLAMFVYAGTVVVGSIRSSGFSQESRRLMWGTGLAAWGVQLAWISWLPTFLFQQQRANAQLWMSPMDWNKVTTTCWKTLAGGKNSEVWHSWTWLSVVIWGALTLALVCRRNRAERLVGLCAGIPLLGAVIYGLSVRNILGVRYLIFAHVYFLVGTGLLIRHLRWQSLQFMIAILIVCWSGYWHWKFAQQREFLAEFPGVQGAVAYLDDARSPGEPVIVSSPFLHTTIMPYTRSPANVFVRYHGDHRGDLLRGPPLRAAEYQDVDRLLREEHERIWTVNAAGLFGGFSSVEVPEQYVLVSEERFPERFGNRMDVLIREYRSTNSSHSATQRHDDDELPVFP